VQGMSCCGHGGPGGGLETEGQPVAAAFMHAAAAMRESPVAVTASDTRRLLPLPIPGRRSDPQQREPRRQLRAVGRRTKNSSTIGSSAKAGKYCRFSKLLAIAPGGVCPHGRGAGSRRCGGRAAAAVARCRCRSRGPGRLRAPVAKLGQLQVTFSAFQIIRGRRDAAAAVEGL
jgi:hypothetical protein